MAMFTGKVALVTGGTGGIGRAAAVAFAKEGAAVAVSGRRQVEGDETARLVRAAGGDGLFVRCDVSRSADVEAMVAAVEGSSADSTSRSTTPVSPRRWRRRTSWTRRDPTPLN